jgi:hypothetical protein
MHRCLSGLSCQRQRVQGVSKDMVVPFDLVRARLWLPTCRAENVSRGVVRWEPL